MDVPVGAGRRGRALPVLAGLAMSAAVGWSYTNISAVTPELAKDYGVSVGSIGFLSTVVLIVYTAMQLPTGRILDRLGPLRIGMAGLALIAVANGIALAGPSFWLALAGRTVLGSGTPLAYLGGLELLRRAGGSAQVLGFFGAVNGGSMGVALLLVPQLDPWLGFRGPYLTSQVLVAVAAVLAAPGLVRRGGAAAERTAAAARVRAAPPRVPTREMLREPELRRLAVMNLCSAAYSPIVSSWVVALLVEAGGYSTAKAGAVGSLTLLALVASRPISGQLVHRRPGSMRAWIAASAAMGVGGCAALAVAGPVWLACIGCFLVGISTAVPWTYVFNRAPQVRPEAAGTAFAVVSGLPLLLAIAGIPLVGLTFSLPGDGRIGFAALAVAWALLLFVLPARVARP